MSAPMAVVREDQERPRLSDSTDGCRRGWPLAFRAAALTRRKRTERHALIQPLRQFPTLLIAVLPVLRPCLLALGVHLPYLAERLIDVALAGAVILLATAIGWRLLLWLH